jgi:hypothetical protein
MSAADKDGAAVETRERKRSRFDESAAVSNRRRSTLLVAGVAVAIVLASGFFLLEGGDPSTSVERGTRSPAAPAGSGARPSAPAAATSAAAIAVSPEGSVFRLPASSITTQATFFKGDAGTVTVPFFAVRDASGRVHVALDACQVCARAKKGYVQDGDHMQCRNCGMTFAIAEITAMGGKGGCHPISLPSTTAGDSIVVKAADVGAGAKWF